MLNKVILMGRLTADPELRMSQSGKEVISFSIAVNRRYQRDVTDFINCVAWRDTAQFIHSYFKKGQLINVVGSLQVRTWDDAQGQRRYSTEVIVDEANFCGGDKPKDDPLNEVVQTAKEHGFIPAEEQDDDLPF